MKKKAFIIISAVGLIGACNQNHPPVISGITCSPEVRSAGTLFTLVASASDEDGDALQYRWSSGGGLFTDSVNRNQTVWKSPLDGNGKTFMIRVTVSDGELETFLDYPIQLTQPLFGNVTGYVFYTNCTIPIPGVTIFMEEKTTITDSSGYFYLVDIPAGNYPLKAAKPEFSSVDAKVNILPHTTLKVIISMTSVLFTSKVQGVVRGQDSNPISGVTVTMLNPDKSESRLTASTDSTGFYRLWYIPNGSRKIFANKAQNEEYGYEDITLNVTITGPEFPLDIDMQKYNLKGQFVDSRDTHQYNYKIIGRQTWMSGNLAYLPAVSPSREGTDTERYYYVYGYQGTDVHKAKSGSNYSTFGVLYNWAAALDACPDGWHLPNDAEWKVLENYLGPNVGFHIKSTSGWTNNGNGDNSSGFGAVPAGERQEGVEFTDLGSIAHFWSGTSVPSHGAWSRALYYSDNEFYRFDNFKRLGFSVRCLKD